MISRRSLIQRVFVFAIFALLAGCASLPDNSSTPKTYAPTEVRDSALVEYFRKPLSAQPNKSGVVVLGDGGGLAFLNKGPIVQQRIDALAYG